MAPSTRNQSSLLVLNAGSSSLKYAVLVPGRVIARGEIQQVGQRVTLAQAIGKVRTTVAARQLEPRAVAHRIVHGGRTFVKPTKLTAAVRKKLTELIPLAPLHMPANLAGLAKARRAWPRAEQWGVFDTAAFHQLPDAARYYSIPKQLADTHGIYKYGFHGISHADVFHRAAKRLGSATAKLSGVTIHLGSGDSVTAWRRGRPIDTSMGFTPLEGLTMATRSGDLDPMIPLYLQSQLGWSVRQVSDLLQQRSGLFGLTGLRDIRDVLGAGGHPVPGWPRRRWTAGQRRHARLALAMFIYDIQRYLASYLGLLPQPKVIVFTGAVGQNAWVRSSVLGGVRRPPGIRILTLPTDEEHAIAEQVWPMLH